MSKLSDFDHPCKQTCSGWRQGYDKGRDETLEMLRDSSPSFDESHLPGHMNKTWIDGARWQHSQDQLAYAALKAAAEKMAEALEWLNRYGQMNYVHSKKAEEALTAYRAKFPKGEKNV